MKDLLSIPTFTGTFWPGCQVSSSFCTGGLWQGNSKSIALRDCDHDGILDPTCVYTSKEDGKLSGVKFFSSEFCSSKPEINLAKVDQTYSCKGNKTMERSTSK